MIRVIIRIAFVALFAVAGIAASSLTPLAKVSADPIPTCSSGTGPIATPCSIGGTVELTSVTSVGGGAFGGGGCGGGGTGVATTILNDPTTPGVMLGGGATPCTITGPFSNTSGDTVAAFSALSGFVIDGATASGVCGVTSGSTQSQTVGVLIGSTVQTATLACPTEPSGMAGPASATISFAPVTSLDFGLTTITDILGGGTGTLESLSYTLDVVPASTPEPRSVFLLGFGLLSLLGMGLYKKRFA